MINYEQYRNEATALALREFPKEACAIVVSGEFIECENTADEPERNFRIHPDMYAESVINGTLEGVWHSHCIPLTTRKQSLIDSRWMTKSDMESYFATKVPWMIVVTEGENVSTPLIYDPNEPLAPLVGRTYIWGKQDCLNLVADYYKMEFGIVLPNIPRDFKWWVDGKETMFDDNYEQFGFKQIPIEQARVGDAVLFKIAGHSHSSHCGVISKQDTLLHHLAGALSIEQPLSEWLGKLSKVLRYEP